MELFRIVGCLHLSNRCPRDADFYIIGDLENHGVAVHAVDGAVDARGGDDLIAVFHRPQHLLHFLALPLLRQYHQEIHDSEHEAERNRKTAKPSPDAALPEKKCCQIHVPNCSMPFRVFPEWARWHNRGPLPEPEGENTILQRVSSRFPSRSILLLRLDLCGLPAPANALYASRAARLRLGPPDNARAALLR